MEHSPATYEYRFRNPELGLEERVEDIISLLTIEEKISCLGTDPSVPRLGIRGSGHIEGLHGVAMGVPGGWGGKDPVPTTTFPQAIGLGQTWDVDLVRRVAEIEGYEARYLFQSERYRRGGIVVRAPNADLGKDPRWGRTEECYGEDAYLAGALTAAFVRGLQGEHPVYWQAASLMKHFLANSNEDGRESSSSDFDDRLFREYYAATFQMGIEAGSRAFMAAYNSYNGTPCAVHPMLKDIAVAEWGQDGIICTDGGAMKLLVTDHKAYVDFPEATAAIVKAGIGQFLDDHVEPTRQALTSGLLAEADIDAALKGNFRVMIRLGLLDPDELVPYARIGSPGEREPWLDHKTWAFSREVARKSVVLLKNDGKLLPLDRGKLTSVAIVGRMADQVHLDWYSGTPPYFVTPRQGLAEAAGESFEVRYEDGADLEAAALAASASDVVIVCVGNVPVGAGGWAKVNSPDEGREAVDRQSIDLPLDQQELIDVVLKANSKTILVLVSSFPYAIVSEQEKVPAIMQTVHNSQDLGSALADILLGEFNPAGRLVQTWPRSLAQLPSIMDYNIRHGHTYQYFRSSPLYPFGFGLSYTTFSYANLELHNQMVGLAAVVTVCFDLTNSGSRSGEEVVQLYISHIDSAIERPLQELKGFQRIALQSGETRSVSISVTGRQLAYWNTQNMCMTLEEGSVKVMVGASSADIRLEGLLKVTVPALSE